MSKTLTAFSQRPTVMDRDQRVDELIFEDELTSFVIRTCGMTHVKHLATTGELGDQWLRLHLLHRVILGFPLFLGSRLVADEAFKTWAHMTAILKSPNRFMFETGAYEFWKKHGQTDDGRPCGLVITYPDTLYGVLIHDAWQLRGSTRMEMRVWMGRGYRCLAIEPFADFIRSLAVDAVLRE